MKKNLIAMLAIAGLLILGSLSAVSAISTTNVVTLNLTVYSAGFLSVTNDASSSINATAVMNQTNVSPSRAIIINNGTGFEAFALKGSMFTNGNPAALTFVTGKPISTQIRAGIIFADWQGAYTPVDFGAEDCLTTTSVAASTTAFATSTADSLKGFNVAAGDTRNMKFGICYGGGLADGTVLKVRIVVKAQ